MSETEEFFAAVSSGNLNRIRELLARTPSLVRVRDAEGATPLHYAAFRGDRELVRVLVDGGADVNSRDERYDATPAGWAIEYLRELGGLLAMEIEDMLFAIRRGDAAWARRILQRMPSLANCIDRDGKPLMQHAEESGHSDIMRLFRRTALPADD